MLTKTSPSVLQRMAAVREAFRLHRLAIAHRRVWLFYLEHNLDDAAKDSRVLMLEYLQSASYQWRLTLGTER